MGKKIVVDLEVKSNKGVKEVEKLNKELNNTNKELSGATDTLDKFTGGAVSKIKGFKGAIRGLTTGFKSLRVAIIATGIGALLIGILAVKTAFTSSEEGQNKFAKLMGVIGSVTGNLVDMLANLGESIISVFENPKQALINFKNAIVENVTNRINAIIDTLGFLGSAIKKVFSGDFSGAVSDAKSAGSSLVDSFTGVKNSIDKVTKATKGFVEELKEEAKIAGQIANQRAKADKLERGLIIERAKANRDRAELLDKAANKEKFTAQERINFLEEAGKIEEEITRKEIESARLRFEAKVAENALSKSTKQDLDDEANLKAKLIDLETARLTKQKLVTSQIVAAKREEVARLKAIDDEEKARKEEEDKLKEEKQKEKDLQEKQRKDQKLKDDELRAQREIELEQQKIAVKEKAFQDAVAIAGAESKVGKAILVAKQLLLAKEMIMEVKATLFSAKNSATKVAVKSAEAGVDVSAGAAKAASAAPFPANIPLILGYAAQAVGIISAIKGAISASKQATKGLGGSVATPTVPAGASTPPAFNVVGASDTNQLASAIGGQSQQPVQAYVVANDVTTAQSMDRNIIDDASLGD
tara:strand:- start:198 stop:1958 length:1761 start_codon:yes stop_codon:yes gene_type:complete